jgi:hypothetical protein
MVSFQCVYPDKPYHKPVEKPALLEETEKFFRVKKLIPNKTLGVFVFLNMGCYTKELQKKSR